MTEFVFTFGLFRLERPPSPSRDIVFSYFHGHNRRPANGAETSFAISGLTTTSAGIQNAEALYPLSGILMSGFFAVCFFGLVEKYVGTLSSGIDSEVGTSS